MNAFDLFDYTLTKPATPAPPASADQAAEGAAAGSSSANALTTTEPSLNDEINQAVGSLGRFWGGFRAQVSAILIRIKCDTKNDDRH